MRVFPGTFLKFFSVFSEDNVKHPIKENNLKVTLKCIFFYFTIIFK